MRSVKLKHFWLVEELEHNFHFIHFFSRAFNVINMMKLFVAVSIDVSSKLKVRTTKLKPKAVNLDKSIFYCSLFL